MKRIVSVLLAIVLLLSITAEITLSAQAAITRFSWFTPLLNKYVIDKTANQFDFFETYDAVENLKAWANGKSSFLGFNEKCDENNLMDVYAKKIGIVDSNGKAYSNSVMSEYEKMAKIYQYLHLTHSYLKTGGTLPSESVIVRTGYCETFSWLVNAFCKRAGIECWQIKGPANHSWNVVKIDGKYYAIDVARSRFLTEPSAEISSWKTAESEVFSANSDTYYSKSTGSGTGVQQWIKKVGSSNLATSTYSKITVDEYGDLINPKTTLSTPSVVSTTATSEGVVVKFKGVSNADWYEVYTAPIDGVMSGVSTTSFDSSVGDFVTKSYSGNFVYYVSGYPVDYRRFSFTKAATVHSIDKNESGQYQCFLENGDGNGLIVFIVAKNVKGQCNLNTDWSTITAADTAKVISLIGKNYLTSCAGKDGSKTISGATAAQINGTNYALYKSNAKHLATNGNHAYSKVVTLRTAGAGTQGAEVYECKNCLQREMRYTAAKSLAKPKISSVAGTATGIKISWGKVAGAAKYRIFYKANGESNWHKAGETTSTSYTWTKAKSNTKYTFAVRCISKDGKTYTSASSASSKSLKYIAAPKISKVENTASGVKISWGKVAGAAKYRIFYKANGEKSWHKAGETTSASFTWKKAKSNTKYTFAVRCIDKDGKTYTSASSASSKSIKYIAAPKISKLSKTSSGIQIKWDKVSGAAKYRIFYKTADGKWKKITDTTSTSYTWKGGKKGTKYTFAVRCIDKDGKTYTSASSASKSIKK